MLIPQLLIYPSHLLSFNWSNSRCDFRHWRITPSLSSPSNRCFNPCQWGRQGGACQLLRVGKLRFCEARCLPWDHDETRSWPLPFQLLHIAPVAGASGLQTPEELRGDDCLPLVLGKSGLSADFQLLWLARPWQGCMRNVDSEARILGSRAQLRILGKSWTNFLNSLCLSLQMIKWR